nr:uncharacterized protein CI109_000639 [Kwoniella shandongensis]KAA5531067.1 hypothetical protein CI109_000639 [Kwoniella shandongensis]
MAMEHMARSQSTGLTSATTNVSRPESSTNEMLPSITVSHLIPAPTPFPTGTLTSPSPSISAAHSPQIAASPMITVSHVDPNVVHLPYPQFDPSSTSTPTLHASQVTRSAQAAQRGGFARPLPTQASSTYTTGNPPSFWAVYNLEGWKIWKDSMPSEFDDRMAELGK